METIYPMSMLHDLVSEDLLNERYDKNCGLFWNADHTIAYPFDLEDDYFHFMEDDMLESMDKYLAELAVEERDIFEFYTN